MEVIVSKSSKILPPLILQSIDLWRFLPIDALSRVRSKSLQTSSKASLRKALVSGEEAARAVMVECEEEMLPKGERAPDTRAGGVETIVKLPSF